MLYRSSSFKKSSRAVTAVAAVGFFVTASFTATAPASAETSKDFMAACASIKDASKRAACTIEAVDKDTAAREKNIARLKAQGAAADVRATAADQVISCLTDIKKFKDRNPEGFAKLGTITRDNACTAASKIPRPTASLN